jgi:MoxR-like ATPase
MRQLRSAVATLRETSEGGAFIVEGLAGIGKSAIVQQLQRDCEDLGVRFLLGSGFAIEKGKTTAMVFFSIFF